MSNGFLICPHKWASDKEIKNELGLLLIISSLCSKKGFCYASNEYLANLFQEDTTTISRKIKKLESKNYIIINYKKRGFEIITREIRLAEMLMDDLQKCQSSIDDFANGSISKNAKENNISINNINNNKREREERKTDRPSLSEIEVYVKENNLSVNPKSFFDYFEAGSWTDSKGNKVTNWKQKLLTWERYEPKERTKEDDEAKKEKDKWDRFLRGEI